MSNKKNSKYAIALITNDAYVDATIVMMKTFLEHNTWYNGDFIVMHDNTYCVLNEESKNRLMEVYPKVYFHCVEDHIYDKFVEHFYDILTLKRFVVSVFTVESFALKYDQNGEEYDKVLYLDVDQIVTGDIRYLFAEDKDMICGPGDDFIYNHIGNKLLKRTRESIGGGLFLIDKKYLGEEIRDEIIRFAENYPLRDPKYGAWDGSGFEMHVLNAWLLNKEVYIAPSTYQFPTVLYGSIVKYMSTDIKIIRDELFRNAKIIHIWDDKPWDKTSNLNIFDLYWNHLYKKFVNPNSDKPEQTLDEVYSSLKKYKVSYKNYEKYKRIFSFVQLDKK